MKNRIHGWFDRGGSPVERELVEHRPEAPASLVRSISARIQQRPARSRVRVGFALGLTAAMVAAIGASGGLGYASSSIRDASSSISKLVHATTFATGHSNAAKAPNKANQPSSASLTHITAACTQYSALPHITGINPTAGKVGTVVTITGSNFSGDSLVTSVTFFNGKPASSFTVDSDTQIRATTPNGATTGPITLTNCKGPSNTPSYTVHPAPTITSFVPTTVVKGQSVTINGSHFVGSGGTNVKFAGVGATPVTFVSSSQVKVNVPSGSPLGTVAVTVTTNGGTATRNITVAVQPTVSGINPSKAVRGQTGIVLAGAHFVPGHMSVLLVLSGNTTTITPTSTTSTQMTFTVPSNVALNSSYTVRAKDADGTSTSSASLKIPGAPTLSGLNHSSGARGSTITLNGSGYVKNQMTVTFTKQGTSTPVNSPTVSFVSGIQIQAVVPNSLTVGATYNVAVKDANGTSTTKAFKVTG